jgi:hypothetical protein
VSSDDEVIIMAKGQSRRNREVRKPKADKPKVLATAMPTNSTLAIFQTNRDPKKK